MEHPQVIPIIRNTESGSNQPAGQWSEPQKAAAWPGNAPNQIAVSGGQPWPPKDNPGGVQPVAPWQPMPLDMNAQMRQMQENMAKWQAEMQTNFMGGMPPAPVGVMPPAPMATMPPFPQMQPFPTLPAQDTRPAIDPQGFYRLTPLPAGMPGMGMNSPLDIPDVVVQCKDGSKKFLLKYDVSDFKRGEVKVEINGNQLKVSGNHEETSGNSVIKRTYHKEHPLPDGLRQDKLRSVLSPEGILTIEAPVIGDVPVGTQQTPMIGFTAPQRAPPVAIQNYQSTGSSTLPRTEKRRVKFCEDDP